MPRNFTILNKSIFLLLFYILLSTILMNFSDESSLRGIRWAMLQTLEYVDALKTKLTIRRNLAEENEILKKENFKLHITNQRLREMVLENSRLKEMLELKTTGEYRYIPAKVIATGTEKGINSRLLNVGAQDSVHKNMAVVNADGLVGKIIAITSDHSIVQLLVDHNARVGARLQNSREAGVVGWSGNPWLNLNYIPKNIPVVEGEVVITSGLSKIYPPGLKIGVVISIDENEYDLFKTIRIKPAVNFNALEEVFVMRTEIPENSEGE